MLTFLLIAVAAALVWVLIMTTWLWQNQERVVFQPPGFPVDGPPPAVRVHFRASDGHALFGYLVRPDAEPRIPPPQTVVLAFHGNADLAAWQVPWARMVAERTGAIVLLAEYRGYGGIPGTPTYANASADAQGALEYARTELVPPGNGSRVVLFGHSLGSAIASDLAVLMEPDAPAALVLQSPFTSAREMAARMLVPPIPWLWRRISRVPYDTRTVVSQLECPVWVVHGSRDVVIPARMGRAVFAAAKRPAELLLVPGAGHNDVADIAGERYWRWLAQAIGTSTAVATSDAR